MLLYAATVNVKVPAVPTVADEPLAAMLRLAIVVAGVVGCEDAEVAGAESAMETVEAVVVEAVTFVPEGSAAPSYTR